MEKEYINPQLFTVILTSCGRFDLLHRTLQSFLTFFDVEKLIVVEDSGDEAGAAAFAAAYPQVDMRVNRPKLGQICSIDQAYASVTTPYVVHLEDDWEFTRGVNMGDVVELLQKNPKLTVAVFAFDHYRKDLSRFTETIQIGQHEWGLVHPKAHKAWFSFTFNPSVVSIELWRAIGPFEKFGTEKNISIFLKKRGGMVARLVPRAGFHIGDERHVHDEFRPRRPATLAGWIKYAYRKLWLHFSR